MPANGTLDRFLEASLLVLADLRDHLIKSFPDVPPEQIDAAIDISTKYAEWIIGQIRDLGGTVDLRDTGNAQHVSEALEKFERVRKLRSFKEIPFEEAFNLEYTPEDPANIRSWDIHGFLRAMHNLDKYLLEPEERVKREKEGAQAVTENEAWTLIKFSNIEATMKYCKPTSWCTRGPEWAKTYLKEGPLYMVVARNSGSPKYLLSVDYHIPGTDLVGELQSVNREHIDAGDLPPGVQELLADAGLLDRAAQIVDPKGPVLNQSFNSTLAAAVRAFQDIVKDPAQLDRSIVNILMDATMLEGTLRLRHDGEAATLTPGILQDIFERLRAGDELLPQYKDLTFQQWATSKGVAAVRRADMSGEESGISFYTDAEIRAMALADRFVSASRIVLAFTPEEAKKRFGAGLERAGIGNVDEAVKAAFDIATMAMTDPKGRKIAAPDRYAYWLLDKMSTDPEKIKDKGQKENVLRQRTDTQVLMTDKDRRAEAIEILRRFQMDSGKKLYKKLGLPSEIEKYGSIADVINAVKSAVPINRIGESSTWEVYFATNQTDAMDNVPADDSKKDSNGHSVEHWCTRYSPDNAANYYPEGPVFFMFEKNKQAGVRDAYALTVDRIYSSDQIGEIQNKRNDSTAKTSQLPQGALDAIKAAQDNIAKAKEQEGAWVGAGGVDLKTYLPDNLMERVTWIGKRLEQVPQMKGVIRKRNMNMLRTVALMLEPMLAEGKSINDIISTIEKETGVQGEWKHFADPDAHTVSASIRDPEELFNGLVKKGVIDDKARYKLVSQYVANSKYRKFFKDDTDFDSLAKMVIEGGSATIEFGGDKLPIRVDLDVNDMMLLAKNTLKHDQIISSFRNAVKDRVEDWGISIFMDPKKLKWADYAKHLYEKGFATVNWNRHKPGASDESKAANPIDIDGQDMYLDANQSGLITEESKTLGIAKLVVHALGGHVKGGPEGIISYVRELQAAGTAKMQIGMGSAPARLPAFNTLFDDMKANDLIDTDSLTRAVAAKLYTQLGGHVRGGVDGIMEFAKFIQVNGLAYIDSTINLKKKSNIKITVATERIYEMAKNEDLIDNDSVVRGLAEKMYPLWSNLVPDANTLVPMLYKFMANNQVKMDTLRDAETGEETSAISLHVRGRPNVSMSAMEIFDTGVTAGIFNEERMAGATAKMIYAMFGGHIIGGEESLTKLADKIYKTGHVGVKANNDGRVETMCAVGGPKPDQIFDLLVRGNLVDDKSIIEEAARSLTDQFGSFASDDPKAATKAAAKLYKDRGISLVPMSGDEPSSVRITADADVVFYTVQRAGMIDNSKIVDGVVSSLRDTWGTYLSDDDERLRKAAQELVDEENAYLKYDEEGIRVEFGEQKKKEKDEKYDAMAAAREKIGRHRLADPAEVRSEMKDHIASAVEKILREPLSATTFGNIIDESKKDKDEASKDIAEYLMDHYKPMEIDEGNAHSFLDNEAESATDYINKLYRHGDPHYMEQARGYPKKRLNETNAQYAERIQRRMNSNAILQGKISRKNILEAAVMLNIANRNGMQTFSTYYWDWSPKNLKHMPRPPLHMMPLRPGEQDPFAKREPTEEQAPLPFGEPGEPEPPETPPAGTTPKKKRQPKKKAPGAVAPEEPQPPAGEGSQIVAFRLSSFQA